MVDGGIPFAARPETASTITRGRSRPRARRTPCCRVRHHAMTGSTEDNPALAARLNMREGSWQGDTLYKVPGHVQCNLVVLPQSLAYDFLLYSSRNHKACPLLEV